MMPAWCGDGPFGGLLQSATNVTGIFCLPHEEAIVVFMPTTKVLLRVVHLYTHKVDPLNFCSFVAEQSNVH